MPDVAPPRIPPSLRPDPRSVPFDLDAAIAAVVGLAARVPDSAFTAEVLGTERAGQGVVIRDDLVLTVGYLVTEAEEVWLTTHQGESVAAHPLAVDFESGFALVQSLSPLKAKPVALGSAETLDIGADLVIAGAGGRDHALAARLVARQEFAGYWEYLVDDALFTAPGHPHWGGAAVIGPDGQLVGLCSLQLAGSRPGGATEAINMSIPVDVLAPVFDDMVTIGRTRREPRPWLGAYVNEIGDQIVVVGVATDGPADRAGLQAGDVVSAIADDQVQDLASFYRRLWSLGRAGTEVPLSIERGGRHMNVVITSGERARFLRRPRFH
jgi:S1-C subfamily serine protease